MLHNVDSYILFTKENKLYLYIPGKYGCIDNAAKVTRDDSVIGIITCSYLSRLLLQRGSVPQALFLLISCSFPHTFYLKRTNGYRNLSLPCFFSGIIQLPLKMKSCCWALPGRACPSLARPTGPHLPSLFLDSIHMNSFSLPSEPHN